MKKIVIFLLMGISLNCFSKEQFKIKSGTYFNKNCFLKISQLDSFIKIQFAFRPQYNFSDTYDEDNIFTPERILGTNVLYDKLTQKIEFGPGRCTGVGIKKVRSRSTKKSWKISCGGNFQKTKVKLILRTDKYNNLSSFSYKEATNFRGYRLINWPWLKKPIYNFKCRGFKFSPRSDLSY